MCGPLALSLPIHHFSKTRQHTAIGLYNLGRVLTYSSLGLLLGLAGRQLYLAGWQQLFSIVLGIVILSLALHYFFLKKLGEPRWLAAFHQKVIGWMSRLLRSNQLIAFLGLGAANGLLPCGMVYLAIAGALSTSQLWESVLFMFSFGMATLPAMIALNLAGLRINMQARKQIKRSMPLVVAFVAMVLILRGLNLGIPFISPVLPNNPGAVVACP
jgi:sulfite exporter TauE/SafE